MIPRTYPTVVDSGVNKIVVYPLTSVTGLQAWIDYIPVKEVTGVVLNSYSGTIDSYVIPSITDKQAWLDYIPVFVDNTRTASFSTDSNGFIPLSAVGAIVVPPTTSNIGALQG